MSRPFILLRNSTSKSIPKRGQYGLAVYIADPEKQLKPWEVFQYIATAEGALTINLPVALPLLSEDVTDDDSEDEMDCTQRTIDFRENIVEPLGNNSRLSRQQPYDCLLAMWSSRTNDVGCSVRPRIQEETTGSWSHHTVLQHPIVSGSTNMDTPPPQRQNCNGIGVPIVGNSQGASSSNPLDLDDDMSASYARSAYANRSLSQYEEETLIALDEEWNRATKEYNSLCIDELPDVLIASMAGDRSPEHNSKDTFWSTFVGVDPSTLGDDNVPMAWDVLNKRRMMRRGLSNADVGTTLPTLLTHNDFSMWTVSQVEGFSVIKRTLIRQPGIDWIYFLKCQPLSLMLQIFVEDLLLFRWTVQYQWIQLEQCLNDSRNGKVKRIAIERILFKQRLLGPIGGWKSCGIRIKIATSNIGFSLNTEMLYDTTELTLYR